MSRRVSRWVTLVVLVLACTFPGRARAEITDNGVPLLGPPGGDWTISAGHTVIIADEPSLALGGNLLVEAGGVLQLVGSTLSFAPQSWAGTSFWSYGAVHATDSRIASSTGNPVFVYTGGASHNEFRGCTFDPTYCQFSGQSTNVFGLSPVSGNGCRFSGASWTIFWDSSDNQIEDTVFGTYAVFEGQSTNAAARSHFGSQRSIGGWASESSTNVFTDCTFTGFEFHSPSRSDLGRCTFAGGWGVSLFAEGNSSLQLADLAPGHQELTTLESPTDGFRVALTDSDVNEFRLEAHSRATVVVSGCSLRALTCCDYSQTQLTNSRIGGFLVNTNTYPHAIGQGGTTCPFVGEGHTVDLSVSGIRDDNSPLSADISSGNSPFSVTFRNTTIWERADFYVGDSGGPVASRTTIDDSHIMMAVAEDDASVLVRHSFVGFGGVGTPNAGDTASFTAEDSTLGQLWLDGTTTRALLRRSEVTDAVQFWTWNLAGDHGGEHGFPSSPRLELDAALLSGQILVQPKVGGALVSGTAVLTSGATVATWAADSTVTRSFPVLVKRSDGTTAANVPVTVTDSHGTVVWGGTTEADGYAHPKVAFDAANYSATFTVTATTSGSSAESPLGFLSSTPIELTLPIVYKIHWLPPLHDGTSETAADGPFKRGRTIPVKFELLNGDGRRVPDAEAERMVAQLQVFYEVDTANGDPIDSGDYPPDEGAEFRYQGGQFHYNLSTKDRAWLAGYTYGLEVLVDGSVVGKVFFSLK
jgi:hypothetical protein